MLTGDRVEKSVHTLNNLLSGVIGNAELLKDSVPSHGLVREMIDEIIETSHRALQISTELRNSR